MLTKKKSTQAQFHFQAKLNEMEIVSCDALQNTLQHALQQTLQLQQTHQQSKQDYTPRTPQHECITLIFEIRNSFVTI